jgi:ribonucleoside-diphosphate reductase alpha chain
LEQGLPAWGVCNLQHLVLSRFYDKFTNDVEWNDLSRAVRLCIRYQDNIIDYTDYFTKENEDQQKGERRIGMGTMGLATLMIKLGLRYGSDEGCRFIENLYEFIAIEAYKESIDLAEEKGKFPMCDPVKMSQSGFMKRLLKKIPQDYSNKFFNTGIRNVTLLTQAPTGSTGTYIDNLLMQYDDGTSTGIEPYFAFEYWRVSRSGSPVKQELGLAKKWKENNGKDDLPDYYVTAQDLSPDDHIKVQAAVQKWTDSSISKTANCPEEFTVADTARLYELAFDLGCKGVTIYRANSRQAQVLSVDKDKAKLETDIEEEELQRLNNADVQVVPKYNPTDFIQKRPKRLYGFTEKVSFTYGDNMGKAYVTINLYDGDPWEVFISTKIKEVSAIAKALGLMTTKLLRLGCTSDNLQQAIDTLTYDQTMGNLSSQLANILKQLQKEKMTIQSSTSKNEIKLAKCPSCGVEAYDKANCICHSCGVSKCN